MLSGFLKSKVVYKFVSLLVLVVQQARLARQVQQARLARLAPQVQLVLPDRPALPVRMAKTATPVQQRPSALAP